MADDTSTTEPPASATDDLPPDLGDAGKQAIDRMKAERDEARRLARKEQKDRDDLAARLKQFEDRDKTDAQKLEERAAKAEQQLTPLQSEAQRLQFALRKAAELDPAQIKPFLGIVDRLRGSTDEELSADADALLALLGNAPPAPPQPPPSFDGGARGGGTPTAASVASGAALFAQRHKPTNP